MRTLSCSSARILRVGAAGSLSLFLALASGPSTAHPSTARPNAGRPSGAAQTPDPVLAAAGDIACPTGPTAGKCQQAATAALAAAWHPSAVAVLGDDQYESGLLSEFDSPGAYNDTWGRFNPIVHPTTGNHEYAASAEASGYFSYFGSAAPGSYYSYDLGAWHIVSLNSNCSDTGCGDFLAGSTSTAQVNWLRADLAAHTDQCVLAYWHHPAFSSGSVGNSPGVKPLWEALYAAHADVVLNGHDHLYERFAQQDPSQNATSGGLREFVVGTGGEDLSAIGLAQPNMQVVDNHDFGVLFLTLRPSSYEWAFRAADGTPSGRPIDRGSTACHARPFTFSASVRATSLRRLAKRGLLVRIRCSRACDVRISVRVRVHGRVRATARFHETAAEIARARGWLSLRLSRRALRQRQEADGVRLTVVFAASDASDLRSSVRRSLLVR